MAIYIKSMEMPKDGTCNNCPMAHYHHADDTWSCNVRLVEHDGFIVYAPLIDRNADGNFIRPTDCPLTEVPEPHGRLIDADALADDLEADGKEFGDEIKLNCASWLRSNATPTAIERSNDEDI